jgi:4a-hydroxytetrahydrobiopterin dehydratase
MARWTDEQIDQALAELPPWERSGDVIVRELQFATFSAAIAGVNRIAELAEQADHHPDIDIRYRTVRLALTTHSERGLTDRDFALAQRINELAAPG